MLLKRSQTSKDHFATATQRLRRVTVAFILLSFLVNSRHLEEGLLRKCQRFLLTLDRLINRRITFLMRRFNPFLFSVWSLRNSFILHRPPPPPPIGILISFG